MKVYRNGRITDEPTTGALALGEAPASFGIPALRTPWCTKRLVRDHGLMGYADSYYDCTNVFEDPQPPSEVGRGNQFDGEAGAEIIALNQDLFEPYDRVLVLGLRALESLTRGSVRWDCLVPEDHPVHVDSELGIRRTILKDGTHVMSIPHPSGIVRTWNDPTARDRIYRHYRRFMGLDSVEHEPATMTQTRAG